MSRKKPARVNQWKLDNEAFLAEKAMEEGVTVLDNGVIIQTLEKGHGSIHPRPGSLVYAHYTGRLIDSKVFDSTEGESLPALFRVRDLIMGWQSSCEDVRGRQVPDMDSGKMGLRLYEAA